MDSFKNLLSITGKTALVIGVGGLGTPIAQALMENGADVIVCNRAGTCPAELEQIAKKSQVKVFSIPVNLLDENSITDMVSAATQKTDRIDILVNAAGVNKLIPAEEYDSDSWDYVMGINMRGVHQVTREVGKIMIGQKYGRILSISSVKSFIGTDKDYIAYCASKGALNMYTKQLACEWGKYGITVNAIAPTFTRTPINSFQLDNPDFYNALINRIPLGRICTSQDIGSVAAFLCSDAAAFVTGQVLALDGGLTAKQ